MGWTLKQSFNSLQAGRHIQTMDYGLPTYDFYSFNSLQAGRHIQTHTSAPDMRSERVSIPFKREGTFRLITAVYGQCVINIRFNSLQAGRHIQTRLTSQHTRPPQKQVSIPFKREGTFRRAAYNVHFCRPPLVSIPFKREGTFRQVLAN